MIRPGDAAVTTADDNLPERFDLASELPEDDRLATMRVAFPEATSDGKIDFDALRRSLGDWVDPGLERFGLTWPGKAECMRVIQRPSLGTLVPTPDDSVDWDTTENVIIEGDNLEVLKLLQKAYYGQVKMIYIDPPYNTGKEFIYPDNYREGLADYLRYSGQTDEGGLKLTANTELDGRYHSKWLSMMYPRLFLARNLLRDDGAIFVTIDDHEVHNLRAMMNEIFGEENLVAAFIWQHSVQPKGYTDTVSLHHNTVLCYQRSDNFELAPLERTEEHNKSYSNPDEDPRGPWRSGDVRNALYRPNLRYEVPTPSGGTIPPPENGWRWSWATMQEKIASGEIVFNADETKIVRKIYLSTVEGRAAESIWFGKEVGTTRDGVAELKELFGGTTPFDTPKPTALVKRIMQVAGVTGDDLVLDFFAGSGTTAHAVLAANVADGSTRRFLLVQLPEPTGKTDFATISAITKARVRLARQALQGEIAASSADLGYRSLRLAASNFKIWQAATATAEDLERQLEMSIEHEANDARDDAVLTELLLKAGYALTSPVSRVDFAGITGYSIADGALLICLSRELSIEAVEAMAALDPAMIVVLDAGFDDSDELKVNALQTVRARNQQSGSDITLRVV
jgi:adenine-specific DNA-methyltransferase